MGNNMAKKCILFQQQLFPLFTVAEWFHLFRFEVFLVRWNWLCFKFGRRGLLICGWCWFQLGFDINCWLGLLIRRWWFCVWRNMPDKGTIIPRNIMFYANWTFVSSLNPEYVCVPILRLQNTGISPCAGSLLCITQQHGCTVVKEVYTAGLVLLHSAFWRQIVTSST